MIAAGILERDYRYYAILIIGLALATAVSLLSLIRLPVSPALAVWAVAFALLAVQLCGVVHDAGHRAVFRSTALNDLLGGAVACLLAMGFHSWRVQHNAHHAHTNVEGRDPDLDIPLHAFTLRQFQQQGGLWRSARRYQAAFFYPLRTLVVFSRRLAEVGSFRRQRMSPRLLAQMALWAAGIAAWFIVPFLVFPLAKALLLFAVVHPTMGFYLSNVFAPNHKGMPQIAAGLEVSFLEQQISTSRNITPGWFVDCFSLGLNYQIEHHLFPTCPRNKLKQITPYVLAICARTNLVYTQVGILRSNRIILGELNAIARGREARRGMIRRDPGLDAQCGSIHAPSMGLTARPRLPRTQESPMPVALFIGNLDYATSEQELRDLFAQAGTVERVSIPTDRETGRVRGFGFVDMATIEEAHAAIQQFDGASLGGRTIRVNLAEERRSGRR